MDVSLRIELGFTMPHIRKKLILASFGLALLFSSVANAQISQMRLFSPYPDDQFGGGAYMNEGLYGSVGAGLITITNPPTQIVGYDYGRLADTPYAITRITGGGTYTAARMPNQITTAALHSDWTSASQFEVGNRRGHHGWSIKGTIITPQSMHEEGFSGSVNILDPQTVLLDEYVKGAGTYYVWADDKFVTMATYEAQHQGRIGHLWALIDLSGGSTTSQSYNNTDQNNNSSSSDSDSDSTYAFAPIPIIFKEYKLNTKVNTWSVEAMYTYRFHPFRVGSFEFLAGMKYNVFDDKMDFLGHATTRTSASYTDSIVRILNKDATSVTNATGTTTSSNQSVDTDNQTTDSFSGADLGYSSWNFEANNQIIGPQIGGRYILSNNRWRIMGESTFFAGFNRQNINGDGFMGLLSEADQEGNLSETGNIPTMTPLNTVANRFAYSEHFNEFTPGVNTKVEAAWYWTQVVSFKVGYDLTYLGNIARSTAVNDYRINPDGSYFGVKGGDAGRDTDLFVHGVMFTVQVNK